jgi:hypothetical protein
MLLPKSSRVLRFWFIAVAVIVSSRPITQASVLEAAVYILTPADTSQTNGTSITNRKFERCFPTRLLLGEHFESLLLLIEEQGDRYGDAYYYIIDNYCQQFLDFIEAWYIADGSSGCAD